MPIEFNPARRGLEDTPFDKYFEKALEVAKALVILSPKTAKQLERLGASNGAGLAAAQAAGDLLAYKLAYAAFMEDTAENSSERLEEMRANLNEGIENGARL